MNENDNNPDLQTWIDPALEARIVAWVLGDASAFEGDELKRLLAENPELKIFAQRIQAVHGLVATANAPDAEPMRLSPVRRRELLERLGHKEPRVTDAPVALPARRHPSRWHVSSRFVLGLAACLIIGLIAVGLFFPAMSAVKESAKSRRSAEPLYAMREEDNVSLPQSSTTPSPVTAASKPSGETSKPRENVDQVKELAGEAQSYYDTGRFDLALKRSEQVLTADPYNTDARKLQEEINEKRDQQAMAEYNHSRVGRERHIDMAWNNPVRRSGTGEVSGTGGGGGFGGGNPSRLPAGAPLDASTLSKALEQKPEGHDRDTSNLLGLDAKEEVASLPSRLGQKGNADADFSDRLQQAQIPANLPTPSTPTLPGAPTAGAAVTAPRQEVEAEGTATQLTQNGSKVTNYRFFGDSSGNLVPAEPTTTGSTSWVKEKAERSVTLTTSTVTGRGLELTTPAPVANNETKAAKEPFSTFSLHVSDVSFRLAQAALAKGEMPDVGSIRPEEFYNAFDYGDPSPGTGEKVGCQIEQSAHPFIQQRNLVRIAMKVPATGRAKSQPLRLTVLLDTSGSMEREDRAASVRRAVEVLATLLGPEDRVNLIGFSRQPRLLAEDMRADEPGKLVEAIASTPMEGGTNLEEALKLGSELALRHRLASAQNRVVLLTDGAANLGNANAAQLGAMIEKLRQQGVAFDACGVGADGLNDEILEALTRKGDGRYYVLDRPEDADTGFARQLAGAFRPAARNVKVQVRFNPARVRTYRLIGFEKHRLKKEDFRNDKVDAAELAAEEAAVALYQAEVLPEGEGELGEVFVRFLDPSDGRAVEQSWTIAYDPQARPFDQATPSIQLAGTSAFLAEKLIGGPAAASIELDKLAPVINRVTQHFSGQTRVQELAQMFEQMRRLMPKE